MLLFCCAGPRAPQANARGKLRRQRGFCSLLTLLRSVAADDSKAKKPRTAARKEDIPAGAAAAAPTPAPAAGAQPSAPITVKIKTEKSNGGGAAKVCMHAGGVCVRVGAQCKCVRTYLAAMFLSDVRNFSFVF